MQTQPENALVKSNGLDAKAIEAVLLTGDLSKLTSDQRLSYLSRVCETLGINALTQPFQYITFQGKTVLYATRACTEQLRQLHGVSVDKLDKEHNETMGLYIVTAYGKDKNGRADTGTGAVNVAGKKGDDLANAIMKAETKAKRRMTLSICGLGILDESELDTIPRASISRQEALQSVKVEDETQEPPTEEELQEAEHKAVRTFDGIIEKLEGFELCSIAVLGCYHNGVYVPTKVVVVDEKMQADFRKFFQEKVAITTATLEKRNPKTNTIFFEARTVQALDTKNTGAEDLTDRLHLSNAVIAKKKKAKAEETISPEVSFK